MQHPLPCQTSIAQYTANWLFQLFQHVVIAVWKLKVMCTLYTVHCTPWHSISVWKIMIKQNLQFMSFSWIHILCYQLSIDLSIGMTNCFYCFSKNSLFSFAFFKMYFILKTNLVLYFNVSRLTNMCVTVRRSNTNQQTRFYVRVCNVCTVYCLL